MKVLSETVWGILHSRLGARLALPARAVSTHRAGFTLVEMLVVLVILAVLMGLLFIPMFQTVQVLERTNMASVAQDRLGNVMMRLERDISEAQLVIPTPVDWDPDTTDADLPEGHDSTVLSRLDLYLTPAGPAGVVRPSGTFALPFGGGTPTGRVVRYFVAPLPNQPAGPMWGADAAEEVRTGYMNPYIALPGTNLMGPLADPATANMAVLYRVEFDLGEPPFNDPGLYGALYVTNPNDAAYPTSVFGPYFYMNSTPVTWGGSSRPLGTVFRDLAEPLTPTSNADCGLYAWNPSEERHEPQWWGTGTGELPGVLPGLAIVPEAVTDDAAKPDRPSTPEAPRDTTSYKASYGMWLTQMLDPVPGPDDPGTYADDPPPAWVINLMNYGDRATDTTDDPADPWDNLSLLYFADSREIQNPPILNEKIIQMASRVSGGGTPPPYYLRLMPQVNTVAGTVQFARSTVDAAEFDGTRVIGRLAPFDPSQPRNVQYQVTFDRDPAVWPFNNSLFEPIDQGGGVPDPGVIVPRRYKVVEGSERVRLLSLDDPAREVTMVRTAGEPGAYQYRINDITGVIEFNKQSPPDTRLVRIVVEYQYRDNFRWFYRDSSGTPREAYAGMALADINRVYAQSDDITITYATRMRNDVQVTLAVYDAGKPGQPQVLTVRRELSVSNSPR